MSKSSSHSYSVVASSDEATVIAEYEPERSSERDYQSEADLEAELIRILQSQAYEYLAIHTEGDLVANLRKRLEELNDYQFTDNEWKRFFKTCVAGANDDIVKKTVRIQRDHVQPLERDDGTTKNIRLIDKDDIHNNRLQVINQYEMPKAGAAQTGSRGGGRYANRYDVTILVNGLPLVHIELKRRGVDLREAFNQINRYQRDSFWAGTGLFEYVQLFVISNGTLTKYYSNTTRVQHVRDRSRRNVKKTSNSYEFTSWWADARNQPISDLMSFAKTFFAKRTLLNILTKFCVLTSDDMLLVMRPYQIVATERILRRIETSINYRTLGTRVAGGYVWHTTGSGKTLTSFKTAQLASKMPQVDKVLFVVDRKDLDYQTMREYDRFEKGAANSNTSTAILKRQLEDPGAHIIITTIQKLATFVKANKGHEVFSGHVVIIFDECHRSQFGEMHAAITKAFRKYNLFGFTGTPIFAPEHATTRSIVKTTEEVFGDKLHTYTIVDAIRDKNVLPFRIDYIDTVQSRAGVDNKEVSAIDTEEALMDPQRIANIVAYTLDHFAQKTRRKSFYEHSVVTNVPQVTRSLRQAAAIKAKRRVRGFNALFATSSIAAARMYYNQFALEQERRQRRDPEAEQLKIALIYSYGPNEALEDQYGLDADIFTDDGYDPTLDGESFDTGSLSVLARDFLDSAIQDYNDMFGTSYDTSADKFENYYKDLSMRMKNREVDLVIVVNMFLSGFDATTMNTLFVDKNLRDHGLIQAFSRTNRILNSVKSYGNIVCFRNLEEATNHALERFGNKDAKGVVVMPPYSEFFEDYAAKIEVLLAEFPVGQMIVGEARQKEFCKLFGQILRVENILASFDEFENDRILSERDHQDYMSMYLDLYHEMRRDGEEKESIVDDLTFEIELVKQVEVNVDYILMLVQRYLDEHPEDDEDALIPAPEDPKDKAELMDKISRAVDASPTLRNKKDLIERFVEQVGAVGPVDQQWIDYIEREKVRELDQIIADERLKPEPTRTFVDRAFSDGQLVTTGVGITDILPPVSRFVANGGHAEIKERVVGKLTAYFKRFYGLSRQAEEG